MNISITYCSNSEGGINDTSNYRNGITVGELFDLKENGEFDNHLVRVNGETADDDQVLSDGDRVTVSPKNVKGY